MSYIGQAYLEKLAEERAAHPAYGAASLLSFVPGAPGDIARTGLGVYHAGQIGQQLYKKYQQAQQQKIKQPLTPTPVPVPAPTPSPRPAPQPLVNNQPQPTPVQPAQKQRPFSANEHRWGGVDALTNP